MRSLLGQRRAFGGWTAAAALKDYLNLLGVVTFSDEREFLYRPAKEARCQQQTMLHCTAIRQSGDTSL
jgi:hypothetical protein